MEKFLGTDWTLLAELSLPLLILTGAGLALLIVAAFSRRQLSGLMLGVGLAATVAAFVLTWLNWVGGLHVSQGMLLFDRLAWSLDLIFLLSLFLTLLISKDPLASAGIRVGEYHVLLLFATVGMMLVAHGGDLILIFLGIEITSISAYILAGIRRDAIRSSEAALKYFILGAFASGFLLYGIALAYGAAGSTSLSALEQLTVSGNSILILLSVALLLIGVGFKIAAVPFHFWSPDVYEGAPTAITAFMASAIKVAGFTALIRIALALIHLPAIPWVPILVVLAILTMTLGNLVAISQSNIKRMLAYSSIAHAGYVLVGVTAALTSTLPAESMLGGVLFYLFAYSFMTIGAFAVVIALGRQDGEGEEISDFAGLAKRHPFLAAAMALFLISLTGIPPTIGFVGKFYVFTSAVEAGLYGLVIVAVLNSAISIYYYLKPVVAMYFRDPKGSALPALSYPLLIAIFLCFFAILYFGIFPNEIYLLARESVRELIF